MDSSTNSADTYKNEANDAILELAVNDFIARSREMGLPVSWGDAALQALRLSDWPITTAWSPAAELWVRDVLRQFEDEVVRWEITRQQLLDTFTPGVWTHIFGVAELLNRVYVAEDVSIELWSTRAVWFWRINPGPALYALRTIAVAENHTNGNHGWHIHPTKGGKHLGYRLLFDAKRTQDDLAWESHAVGNAVPGGSQPFGDPATRLLTETESKSLHGAALHACLSQSRLRHQRFKEWASLFVKPGNKTYVAHPSPASVTLWADAASANP